MSGVEALFVLLSVVALGSALLVVTTKRIVHAALWLVVCLAAIAGCYLLLSAEFLAWVQVLIYLGAVVVLVLFALMLTRAPTGPVEEVSRPQRALAAAVAAAVGAVLLVTLLTGFSGEQIDLAAAEAGNSRETGEALFSAWVLPFEALSLLLLAALIGAVVLSRRDITPAGEDAR